MSMYDYPMDLQTLVDHLTAMDADVIVTSTGVDVYNEPYDISTITGVEYACAPRSINLTIKCTLLQRSDETAEDAYERAMRTLG